MTCYFCNSKNVESIFYIANSPIAGNFLTSPKDDELLPLNIILCKSCGIAQLDQRCFIPKEFLFRKYFYKTHTISTLRDFFYSQAELIHKESGGPLQILEIGGNSCPLGERLSEYGHTFINVDPSDTAQLNTPKDVVLINDFFDTENAYDIKNSWGEMDIIYSANNFAHMEDLRSVIVGIDVLLADKGKLIIQVQDFEYLLKELCFPFFYHEHLFYYTADTLAHLMSNYGYKLVSCSKNTIHGGSINCAFERSNVLSYVNPKVDKILDLVSEFKVGVERSTLEVGHFLEEVRSQRKRIVAYGASGQANILFANFGITSKDIPYIIDDSPLKLGKFTPYSHIEIKHSSFIEGYQPDYILVTAYNFIEEIKSRNPNYKGTWIVPLPRLMEA